MLPKKIDAASNNFLAERAGFEPAIPFEAEYTLSRRAPSTTRTPLHHVKMDVQFDGVKLQI